MLQERTAMGDEYYAGKQRAENMLAERTRERDEAIQRRREVCERFDITVESLKAVTKQRDEAREQLAKLEWPIMFGWGHEDACALCKGCKPTDRPKYTADNYGHRPTCWFAKKEAGANKIRNHRKDCPARTADDVAWVDSQWQVNGCRTSPIEGPRPNPIGCEGCKCTTAKEGAAKPPTVREQWKAKQAAYDHWLDAVGYMLLGVDWAKGNSVTVTTNRPVQPGAAFVYDQSSGIWKLVDKQPVKDPATVDTTKDAVLSVTATKSEPVRQEAKAPALPGPKFAIGQAVRDEYRSRSGVITGFWRVDIYKPWQYEFGVGHVAFEGELTEDRPAAKEPARSGLPVAKTFTEQRDEFIANHARPEPRFKVGEKVHSSAFGTLGEVINRQFVPNLGWRYGVTGNLSASELDLKPAPKFAVGEWVTFRDQRHGEVIKREWANGRWRYEVDAKSAVIVTPEPALTAQTPQHKQCGAGYVFLGRMTNAIDTDWDLWFVKDGSPFVPGPALASDAGDEFHLASDGDKQTRPELIEARRRAIARGLAKLSSRRDRRQPLAHFPASC
jgi:hypothetical protein